MTQTPNRPGIDQLRNLADRAQRHGGLTPDEAARLRDGIDALVTRTEKAERAVNLLADSHRRAEQTEATLTAVRAIAEELIAEGATEHGYFGDAGRRIRAVLDQHGQTPA